MILLSQLDPRWSYKKLGSSQVTIGGYGCTITSIGMILERTPDVVNDRMLSVNGFYQGNLVIWDRIPAAFPELVESVRRVWSYNNDDVKANVPVVVQVDGSPIGAPVHFVVYKGNQQLADPWGGVIRPTYSYVPNSYCVIKLKQTQIPNADEYVLRLSQALVSAENAITTGEQIKDPQWKAKNKANKSKLTALAARL